MSQDQTPYTSSLLSPNEKQENKLFQIDNLYDFSTSEHKSSWESMGNPLIHMKSLSFVIVHDTVNNLVINLNLKTKTSRTVPVNVAGARCDGRGRIVLISSDRKTLQAFDLTMKSKIVGIQTEEVYHFADWIDNENIIVLEGTTLFLLNISQAEQKEIIMEDISNDFHNDIISITRSLDFYAIHKLQNGQYSFLLIKPDVRVVQHVDHMRTVGLCLIEESHSLVMLGPSDILVLEGSNRNSIPSSLPETAYMSHYLKDCNMVVLIGYKGNCVLVDLYSKSIVATHNFQTEVVNSFKVDNDFIIVVQADGKVLRCSLNPAYMLYLLRNNYDVPPQIIDYWKKASDNTFKQFRLSSMSSLKPLYSPLKKYSRDLYVPHGGIHIFHPIISYYFPYFYQLVIRNELNIEYTEDERNIIKGFVDYLIYGGSNLIIDSENYLKWMFIFDRCWVEFSELEAKLIPLFNADFSLMTPDFTPLLQKLEDYHLRNYNFENGLLQKCIKFCKDVQEKKGVYEVESLNSEHVPVKISLDCIYNCQNSYDITLIVFGNRILAHKTILSTSSSLFEVMLDEEGSFQSEVTANQELVLGEDESLSEKDKEKKGELFQLLVRYCYTENIEFSPEDAFPLYEIADQYQVEELKQFLSDKIIAQLSIDTFIEIVKWSELFAPIPNKHLHNRIIEFAAANGNKLLELFSDELTAFPEFLIRLLKHNFRK